MTFLKSLDISASGLTAQRLRMDVVAENVANIYTTRTPDGGVYQRRYVIFQQGTANTGLPFSHYMNGYAANSGKGVSVAGIGVDNTPGELDYNPSHPDANEEGYVQMPNVDMVKEMVDMMSAYRSYEANITALNAIKGMAVKALEISR